MATKKLDPAMLPPAPPIPPTLRQPEDEGYVKPETLKPEDLRASMQLRAGIALDVLEWHARNLADPASSIKASAELLDRAGYVAPAKSKDGVPVGGAPGETLPPIEDEVRTLSDAFQSEIRPYENA